MAEVRHLEEIDGRNWEDILGAPVAVLMLGKSDCEACAAWSAELEQFLADDQNWSHVRFGKMLLDRGGLVAFKRKHTWVAELDVLPFNQIFVNGERAKSFAGGGIDRLLSRLKQVAAEP